MECPICKLINPPSALRCDCGYNFETHEIEADKVLKPKKKELSTMLLLAVCFALFSFGPRVGLWIVDLLKSLGILNP
jgi:hypothetical protein